MNMLRKCLFTICLSAISWGSSCEAAVLTPDVEAVAEVYGDGAALSAVILDYGQPIESSSVEAADFHVPGRNIIQAYVADNAAMGKQKLTAGKYVVLELEQLPMTEQGMEPVHDEKDRAARKKAGKNGPELGSHGNPKPLKKITAEVQQQGMLKGTDGTLYPPTGTLKSSFTRELLVENFKQGIFTDPKQNNAQLMYNLYIPENYDPQKAYPLVLFMHDAGTVSPENMATLYQGKGAVAWTTPEWQAKHPCFVLAPQYDTVIVNDDYQYGPELDRTIHLVKDLLDKYNIDKKRIYNTGQSMGGMTSIAMDVKYPDFFAASYLVACKWDEKVTAPLGAQNIWAVAAGGDPGASPSMTKILNGLEQNGAKVLRQTLDLTAPQTEINKQAANMIVPDCHIYYTLYNGGSHRSTWQHAYDLQPAMEWIFAQHK
ncbi:MAG: hypothetical protein IIT82_06315 [Selenomonas sp.]|nr:hypothetical protein [Selenomonas sp.]MBQ5419944.1 hypothetical protein [Selenomonas sp.]MBQ5502305.1 hypothetical protein [Selenomonas sp.]